MCIFVCITLCTGALIHVSQRFYEVELRFGTVAIAAGLAMVKHPRVTQKLILAELYFEIGDRGTE